MLTKRGCGFNVEVVQGNDSIDTTLSGEIAHGVSYVRLFIEIRHEVVLIDVLPWPIFVFQAFQRKQNCPDAEIVTRFQESGSLVVAC